MALLCFQKNLDRFSSNMYKIIMITIMHIIRVMLYLSNSTRCIIDEGP